MNILASILKLARRFPFFARLYRRMRLKMFGWMQQVESALNPIDLVTSYSFTIHRPYGEAFDARKTPLNTVNWVVPDFAPGSGGHINIFRLIGHLERISRSAPVVVSVKPLLALSADRKPLLEMLKEAAAETVQFEAPHLQPPAAGLPLFPGI